VASLLTQLTSVFQTLTEKVIGLIDFAITIPPVLGPAESLLNTLGLVGDPNPAFDDAVQRAFPDPQHSVEVLSRLPVVIQSLTAAIPATGTDANRQCSNGHAEPPFALQVLVNGQGITLCRR
jgi:phospholipid/cholesterol/gamma-HCH transport system substrate-binding protein